MGVLIFQNQEGVTAVSHSSVAGGWQEPWSESVTGVHPETSTHRHPESVAWDRTGREGEMMPSDRKILPDVSPALLERTLGSLISFKSHRNSRQLPLVSNKLAISNWQLHRFNQQLEKPDVLPGNSILLSPHLPHPLDYGLPFSDLPKKAAQHSGSDQELVEAEHPPTWVLNPGSITYYL